jgi:NADH:ubiquinone oxidoreductase subunit E
MNVQKWISRRHGNWLFRLVVKALSRICSEAKISVSSTYSFYDIYLSQKEAQYAVAMCCRLNSTASGQEPVGGVCEQCREPSPSIKPGKWVTILTFQQAAFIMEVVKYSIVFKCV